MVFRLRLSTVILGLALPTHAAAQQAAPPPATAHAAPNPRKLLDGPDYDSLIGEWQGTGAFGDSGDPLTSRMTFTKPNSSTIALTAIEDAPYLYRYSALWSIEKGTGQLVMLMASSLEGPALYRSSGWVGDRMIFVPDLAVKTGPSSVRFTYVRRDRDTFELTYEYSVKDDWRIGDRQVFTRVVDGRQ